MEVGVDQPGKDDLVREALVEHLRQRRSAFFGLLATVMPSYILYDRFVVDGRFTLQDLARLIGIGLFVWLAVTERRIAHVAVAIITLGAFVVFTALFTPSLG